ncbi:MAG TPA: tetratricopeptide repeat protein [Atribacteraceae bacterium]|nr:tetratricopeptide repeat protein [Atribacteraceae bacterium]
MKQTLYRQRGWMIGILLVLVVAQHTGMVMATENDLYRQAMEARSRGEFDEAYRLFERSVEAGIRVHDAYWEMGMILLEKGSSYRVMRQALRLSPRIVEAFQEHLASSPDDDWSWFRLAYVHGLRSKAPGIREWEEAEMAILRALEISPENSFYLLHLGYIYYKMNELQKAVTVFHQALEKDPTYWEVRYYLALVYLELNEKDLAREELRMITDSLPRDTDLYDRAARELRRLGD